MACIARFQMSNGKTLTMQFFGSLEDCTIDATNIAEDKGYELLIIEEV